MKIVALLTVSIFIVILTVKTVFTIQEYYFFDKFLYRKSPVFGYFNDESEILYAHKLSAIAKRTEDIRPFISRDQPDDNQEVLGSSVNGEYTVVVIGDSYAYGLGVRSEESYPRVLEKLLNKKMPTRVYNLSLPGDNIVENYAKFRLARNYYKPDVYVIGIANNDLLINPRGRYVGQENLYSNLKNTCVADEFLYSWPAHSISVDQLIIDAYVPSFDNQYANICYLEEAIRDMVKENVIFFNFYDVNSPSETANESERADRDIMRTYTTIIRNAGGYIFQLHRSSVSGEYKTVSVLEGHPGKFTHTWFAKALYHEILQNSGRP